MIGGVQSAGLPGAATIESSAGAARELEAIFLKQLFSAMGGSSGKSQIFGGGFQGDLYMDMFVSSIARSVSGRGTGIGAMLERALGEDGSGVTARAVTAIRGTSTYRSAVAALGETPSNQRLAEIARGWLAGKAERWSKDGSLEASDLSARVRTEVRGGAAHFNVRDAGGFAGFNKCNLFAFELVRRAGYVVPLVPRSHGWGYMGADAAARQAGSGALEWGEVVTGLDGERLTSMARGGAPLLLAASAPGDREGHMAVADRIHSVERDRSGRIVSLEFSGWDTGSRAGARYGTRTWCVEGIGGPGRGGLDSIEIIMPRPAADEGGLRIAPGPQPGASILDGK